MPEEGATRAGVAEPFGVRVRRRWRSRRVIVHDASMLPTLRPGDRLLVDPRAFDERPPTPGDLVVLRDPEVAGRLLVKRVSSVAPEGVRVEGDEPTRSRDSRAFGPVPVSALLGRAYRCYAPRERARDL